eukprot:1352402-Amphidinium_carterae.1
MTLWKWFKFSGGIVNHVLGSRDEILLRHFTPWLKAWRVGDLVAAAAARKRAWAQWLRLASGRLPGTVLVFWQCLWGSSRGNPRCGSAGHWCKDATRKSLSPN